MLNIKKEKAILELLDNFEFKWGKMIKKKKENIEPSVLSLFGEILKEELSLAEKTIDISKQA